MTVWTISAEKGSGGLEIATRLAAVTELPLLDRRELSLRANDPDLGLAEIDAMEEQLAHRFSRFEVALAVAAVAFVPVSVPSELAADSRLRRTFGARAVKLLTEVARTPCIILATAAFAALAEHPAAIHARIWAPSMWRVDRYGREHFVDRHVAAAELRRDDQRQHAWARTLYGADLNDPHRFTLVLNASRLSEENVVDILLSATRWGR
jgi:hypothetical protein